MSFADDLADILQAHLPSIGQVFIGGLPDKPDLTQSLTSYPGSEGDLLKPNGVPAESFPRFQVLVRGTDALETDTRANSIFEALHILQTRQGGNYYFWVSGLQRPYFYRLDDSGRYVMAFNLEAHVYPQGA